MADARSVNGIDRAGVIVIRDGRIALIRRVRDGSEYWVVPGGGVEPGETIEQAAVREAREELGGEVQLGPLRIRIAHRNDSGEIQFQSYFEAATDAEEISVTGPELSHGPQRGTYEAVWLPLDELIARAVLPRAVARAVATFSGRWPDQVIDIDEGHASG
jgi:8-oxo-dGTP pyrophosphatase MutT (NUDIX family)